MTPTPAEIAAALGDVGSLVDVIVDRLTGPDFYTPKTLARRLDISERTVRRMLARNEIESYKSGAKRRIPVEAVEAYLDACQAREAEARKARDTPVAPRQLPRVQARAPRRLASCSRPRSRRQRSRRSAAANSSDRDGPGEPPPAAAACHREGWGA